MSHSVSGASGIGLASLAQNSSAKLSYTSHAQLRSACVRNKPFLTSPHSSRRYAKLSVRSAAVEEKDDVEEKGKPAVPPPVSGPSTIVRINPDAFAKGGLSVASQPKEGRDGFGNSVKQQFLPINMDYDGLNVLNVDPPIFSIKDFISEEDCGVLIQAAIMSKKLEKSATGGGAGLPADMRTSTSLALNQEVFAAQPKLRAKLDAILAKAKALVAVPGDDWDEQAAAGGKFRPPSSPGSFSFELPQIAHYKEGQHFLSHEDAFPMETAKQKGYQRRATLLLYLNDVAEGGATKFDIIDAGVQPVKGDALLFFPSFQNGIPDHRTLHTAEDAVSGQEKWVSQIWVSWGLPDAATEAEAKAAATAERMGGKEAKGYLRENNKKKGTRGFGKRTAPKDAPKGFGSKK